jgi:hypothetical protein
MCSNIIVVKYWDTNYLKAGPGRACGVKTILLCMFSKDFGESCLYLLATLEATKALGDTAEGREG